MCRFWAIYASLIGLALAPTHMQVAAPGEDILSTFPICRNSTGSALNGSTQCTTEPKLNPYLVGFSTLSGTSQAAVK